MKKTTILILFFLTIIFSANAQETYSKVKIYTGNKGLQQLAALGIDVTEGIVKKGVWFETVLSQSEIRKVKAAGLKTDTEIEDISAFIAARNRNQKKLSIARDVNEEWPVPVHWEYGSMGGFYTLDEVIDELDSMAMLYPNLISPRAPISNDTVTHEGRKLWWVRISDNPNVNEDEPEVLYTGVHHAREPMSVQQMIWYMWYLLENYDSDTTVQHLVDNTEMYFVPVVNPDGYEYNHTTYPNGGGMWRKNRRNNGDGSYGVDPNRNYGFQWGYDNSGSSPYPGDQTYRGPAPFSEPCIKNMRDFSNEHEFKLSLNYHSYSDLLLYPWGYISDVTPDDEQFHTFGTILTKENNYTYGPSSTTIYPTNGDANDWMYGEQTTKPKSFSFTPEIGNSDDNFWPPENRIIPLCREQMWQNIMAARLAGKYAEVTGTSSIVNGDLEDYATFEIQRIGLTDCDTFSVSLQPLDNNIVAVGDAADFINMGSMETATDSVFYTLRPDIESGTLYRYLLVLYNGEEYFTTDTVSQYFGEEVIVFSDTCENMDNWSSSRWNITGDSHSPNYAITDSPYGNYQNNTTSTILLDTAVDLRDTPVGFLHFWAKWDIEAGYDYVEVMVKEANSSQWTPLTGKYTHPGTAYQDEGQPVYDGQQNDWVKEEIVLQQFAGKEVNLRFLLHSDVYVTGDGFYFDDISFTVLSNTTGIGERIADTHPLRVTALFPNPANNHLTVVYQQEDNRPVEITFYDVAGKSVRKIHGNAAGKVKTDVSDLPAGIYFVSLNDGTNTSNIRKFVKR